MTTYEEPLEYRPHNASQCKYCREKRPEKGQEGITGLLDGQSMWVEPEGFAQVHQRGAGAHRLNQDESKWEPLGIGEKKTVRHTLPEADL